MITSPVSPQLAHLDAHGQGVLTCPECGKKSRISAAAHRDLHVPLWRTPDCGHCCQILFNTRLFRRKDVSLPGNYTPKGGTAKRRMVVDNLSMIGVHFHTLLPHIIQPRDVVDIVFHLDNPQQSELHRNVTVHWVDGKHVGAEFCDLKAYEAVLSFYIRPT